MSVDSGCRTARGILGSALWPGIGPGANTAASLLRVSTRMLTLNGSRGFNPPVPIPDVAYRFRCAAAPSFQDFTMPNVSKATLRTRRCHVRQIEQTDRLRLLR
jgi:hypothetical protein